MSEVQMPELPEGMRWKIDTDGLFPEYIEISLQQLKIVEVKDTRQPSRWEQFRYPNHVFFAEPTKEERWTNVQGTTHNYTSKEELVKSAESVLRCWKRDEEVKSLIGTYPPKTL